MKKPEPSLSPCREWLSADESLICDVCGWDLVDHPLNCFRGTMYNMNTFTHVHSSSRYDRSVDSLLNATDKYMADADLVTFTEVQYEPRERALRNIKGWGFVAGDKSPHNDAGILFNAAVWRKVYTESFKATNDTYFKEGGGRTQPSYITIAVLEHKAAKKRIVVGVVHLASNVEGDLLHKRRTFRTIAWNSAFRNTRKRVNEIAKKHDADGIMYIADFNVDFKKAWVRALVKTVAPAFTLVWKKTNITGGTLGRRIIDGTLIKGAIEIAKGAELYPDDSSSDHRPYIETLKI